MLLSHIDYGTEAASRICIWSQSLQNSHAAINTKAAYLIIVGGGLEPPLQAISHGSEAWTLVQRLVSLTS